MHLVDDRSADFRERVPAGSARRRLLIPSVLDQKARMSRRVRAGMLVACNNLQKTRQQFKLAHVRRQSVHKDQRLVIFDASK